MDKSTLESLLERVEKATGPDRDVDSYLYAALVVKGPVVRVGPPTYKSERLFASPDPKMDWIGYDLLIVSPGYTASIDAALGLVERILPNQHLTLGRNVHHHYWLCTFNVLDEEGTVYSNGQSHAAPTPPIAVISALLRALIARATP